MYRNIIGSFMALAGLVISMSVSTGSAQPAREKTTATNPPVWSRIAPMPTARDDLAAATGPDGRIYAMGGYTGQWPLTGFLNVVEAYTPATNTWTTVAPLPTARGWLRATTGKDGRIYAIGGDQRNNPGGLRTIEAYTPATNTWTTLAPMPTARRSMGVVTGPDGRIYAIGGCDQGSCDLTVVEAYTPATNTWTTLAPLLQGCGSMGAVLGSDQRIYAIGGFRTAGPLATVEAYAPATNTWTYVASLPGYDDTVAAVTAPDGRIFAMGGNTPGGLASWTTYAYAPDRNRWTSVAQMTEGRYAPAATLGPDGRIYVVGGANGSSQGQNSAEVYGPAISLSAYGGHGGDLVTLTGNNFAANATVRLYWSDVASGELLVAARTDKRGALGSVQFRVPIDSVPGTYHVIAVDDKSHYRVHQLFTVTN